MAARERLSLAHTLTPVAGRAAADKQREQTLRLLFAANKNVRRNKGRTRKLQSSSTATLRIEIELKS